MKRADEPMTDAELSEVRHYAREFLGSDPAAHTMSRLLATIDTLMAQRERLWFALNGVMNYQDDIVQPSAMEAVEEANDTLVVTQYDWK